MGTLIILYGELIVNSMDPVYQNSVFLAAVANVNSLIVMAITCGFALCCIVQEVRSQCDLERIILFIGDVVLMGFVLVTHNRSYLVKYWMLFFRISSLFAVCSFCMKPCMLLPKLYDSTMAMLSLLCFVLAEVLLAYHSVLTNMMNVEWWYSFFFCVSLFIYVLNGICTVVRMVIMRFYNKIRQTNPYIAVWGWDAFWSVYELLLLHGPQFNFVYLEYQVIVMVLIKSLAIVAYILPAICWKTVFWQDRDDRYILAVCLSHFVLMVTAAVNRSVFVATEAQLIQSNLDAKCRVINYVSHEVRTPLNIMLMGLGVLKHDLEGGLRSMANSQHLVELIHDIYHSCDVAVKIMDDLVAFENADSLPTPRVDIDAFKWLNSCIDKLRLHARSKNVVVRTDFASVTEDMLAFVKIEAEKVDRVVANIFANSVKFSEENSIVSFRCNVEGLESVFSGCDENPLFFTIKIEDSGCGMSNTCVGMLNDVLNDETDTEQISKEFYEELALKNVLSPGVGLVGARNVIHRHGGTISLASAGLGCGTVVSIRIPCECYRRTSDKDSPVVDSSCASDSVKGENLCKIDVNSTDSVVELNNGVSAAAKDPSVSTRGGTLLIVDDSPLVRKLMIKMMTSKGYTCHEADDGDVCLKLMCIDYNPITGATVLKEQRCKVYDAILLDNCMPRLSGCKTVQALRKHGYELPVVGITGNALTTDLEKFASCGADVVFKKPISGDIVLNAMLSLQSSKTEGIDCK